MYVTNRIRRLVALVDSVVPPVLHIDCPNSTQQKLKTSFIKLGNCVKGDDIMEAPAKIQKICQHNFCRSEGLIHKVLPPEGLHLVPHSAYKAPFDHQSNVFHLVLLRNFNISTIRNQFFGKGLPKDIVVNFKSVAKD